MINIITHFYTCVCTYVEGSDTPHCFLGIRMKVFDVDFVVYWLQRHSGSEKKPAKRMALPNSAKWKWLRAVLSFTHTAIDSTMPRWCHGFLFLGACSIQAAVGIDICQTMESTTLIQTRSVSSFFVALRV